MKFLKNILQKKTKFILLSTQRSGTTLLSEYLDSHNDIYMGKELFKTSGEGRNKDVDSYHAEEPVNTFLDRYYRSRLKGVKACGFKIMMDQIDKYPEVLMYIKKNNIPCIYLKRNNILDTAVSRLIARQRKIYHIDKAISLEPENIDIQLLIKELNTLDTTCAKLQEISSQLNVKNVSYDDLVRNKNTTLTEILDFLNISQKSTLNTTLQKINPTDLQFSVRNYAEIEKAIQNTKYNCYLPKKSLYKDFNDTIKALFIHVPKVAGSSIEKSLFGTKGKVGHHTAIAFYQNNPEKFNTYYTFAFVRHPMDRFVSAYEYLKQGGRNKFDKAWAKENLLPYGSFKSFALSLNDKRKRQKVLNWMHFKPQYLFVCDQEKKVLVDFIGKYENLENDFNIITRNLSLEVSLPHENKTAQRKDYHEYYDEETIQIIYRIYQLDFKLFDYSIS